MEHLRALFSTYSSSLKNCYLWAKSYIAVESLKFLKMNSYNSWYYVSFYPFLQLFLKESSQSNYTNFNINNIARIRTSLSLADAETSLQATVSSRSDFCNVMLPGPLASSKRLEDSSLKLSPHCINLTPFHGLPFLVGSDFEALLMTYKLVNGLSPFVSVWSHYTLYPASALHSPNTGLYSVPRARKKSAGCRAFPNVPLFSGITSRLISDSLPLSRPSNLSYNFKKKKKKNHFILTFN